MLSDLTKSQLLTITESYSGNLKSINKEVITQLLEDELQSLIDRKVTTGRKIMYSSSVRKKIKIIKNLADILCVKIILVYSEQFTKTVICGYHIDEVMNIPHGAIMDIANLIDTNLLFDAQIYVDRRMIFISDRTLEHMKLISIMSRI